jgi:hypothetical protein
VFKPQSLGTEVGHASAFKMAFAGFNKGLVALFLSVADAGSVAGAAAELLACLRDFYPGTIETLERLLPSYPRHAGRRADEMDELARWLASEDRDPGLAGAARDVLARLASLGLDVEQEWTMAAVLTAWGTAARAGASSPGDDGGGASEGVKP